MTRKFIRQETIRALFARSGNHCAFPGCTATLINEKNQFIGQICHIEAAEPGGERYNDQQTDEHRRQYENLILLCYPHHIETNDVTEYQATRLFQMKAAHESSHGQKIFKIDESLLFKIASEMEAYWKSIDEAHRMRHAVADLAIPIDADSSYIQLAEASYALLDKLREFREMLCQSDEKLVDWVRDFLQKVTSGELTDDEYDRRLHAFSGNNWEVLNLGKLRTY